MYIRASWYRALLWIVIVEGVNCLYSIQLSCVFKTKETSYVFYRGAPNDLYGFY